MKDPNDQSPSQFAQLLKTFRFHKGLTQAELGKILSVHLATINRWESDITQPTRDQKERVEIYINSQDIQLDPAVCLLEEMKLLHCRLMHYIKILEEKYEPQS